jgi:hypothetical protein
MIRFVFLTWFSPIITTFRSLVSKSWRIVAGECVNRGAPPEILTPRELTELKSKVFALDLSNIHQVFEKLETCRGPVAGMSSRE